jgi:hypothetical protein
VYIALGSLSEPITRANRFKAADQITQAQFDEIDTLHYEVENNVWRLLRSLEKKRDEGSWVTRATEHIDDHHHQETQQPSNPVIQKSNDPSIQ